MIGFSSLLCFSHHTPLPPPPPSCRSSSLFIFHTHRGSASVSKGVFFFFPLSTEREETGGCGGSDLCLFCTVGPVSELVSPASHRRGPVLTSSPDNLLFCGHGAAVHLVGRQSCETAPARRVLVCLPLPLPLFFFLFFSKWQYLKQAQIREPAPVTLTDGAVMGPYPTSSD